MTARLFIGLSLTVFSTIASDRSSLAAPPQVHWVGSWAAAPTGELPNAKAAEEGGPKQADVTIRDVVHLSLGGTLLRVRISNEFGSAPLQLPEVHMARSAGKDAIVASTDRMVMFHGTPGVSIPAGQAVVSDPVSLQAEALSSIVVSLFVPRQPEISLTYHAHALSTNFFAPGNQPAAATLTGSHAIPAWIFLSGVEVAAPEAAAIVALGDSITDGMRSTIDGNRRWTDDLERRLQGYTRTQQLSVLNVGLSGNRILYEQGGPSMLARTDRDVFGQAGVKYLIVFGGINDLHHAVNLPHRNQKESTPDIIAGLKTIVSRAHAHKIKVFGATITPDGGSQFHSAASEQIRSDLNAWIRRGQAYDGWFDFDKAVRDVSDPTKLAAAYDSPDHTHLDDAGYEALANSIDIKVFHP
jgi:lysophospholipase L1-like esterase